MASLYISCLIIASAGAYIRTKESAFDRAMEMFNEIKLIVIMYHLMYFSDMGPEPEDQFRIGYSCLTIVILGTSANFGQLIYRPIKTFTRWLKVRKSKSKARKISLNRSKKQSSEFHMRRVK